MEWKTRQWLYHDRLTVAHDLIERMSAADVVMFAPEALPRVFADAEEGKFDLVNEAIEHRVSVYEDKDHDDGVADF